MHSKVKRLKVKNVNVGWAQYYTLVMPQVTNTGHDLADCKDSQSNGY